ncbi:MAG: winged helix DNA-binding domain-containing protein, partial [Acidimicrobiaceae bacterium]|nr:winged helix DNA-binding domain-containing protein [Acidimicrobiaceae bacterium]
DFPDDDGRMRILGPLDPLIWDRKLVQHIFSFEYIWEVYKPVEQRRWVRRCRLSLDRLSVG